LILAVAIYDGTGDRLQLVGANTEEIDDPIAALRAVAGDRGNPGIGIWTAGVGGALLAGGAFWLGQERRSD
ncbi:MAG: hypothetical protein ACXWU1_00900, partial [Allosphingosinicella sp.]